MKTLGKMVTKVLSLLLITGYHGLALGMTKSSDKPDASVDVKLDNRDNPTGSSSNPRSGSGFGHGTTKGDGSTTDSATQSGGASSESGASQTENKINQNTEVPAGGAGR